MFIEQNGEIKKNQMTQFLNESLQISMAFMGIFQRHEKNTKLETLAVCT